MVDSSFSAYCSIDSSRKRSCWVRAVSLAAHDGGKRDIKKKHGDGEMNQKLAQIAQS